MNRIVLWSYFNNAHEFKTMQENKGDDVMASLTAEDIGREIETLRAGYGILKEGVYEEGANAGEDVGAQIGVLL
jgi:hypothetical protein